MNAYRSRRKVFKKSYVSRFSRAKKRGTFNANGHVVSIKCDHVTSIDVRGGELYYRFGYQSNRYLNVSAMLSQAPEMVNRFTQYTQYRINGLSLIATPKCLPSIGVGDTSSGIPGFTPETIYNGLPPALLAFFPSESSNEAIHSAVAASDTKWMLSPFSSGKQTRYLRFKQNFYEGGSAGGYGTWNRMQNLSQLQGQLSLGTQTLTASPVGSSAEHLQIWELHITFYVQFRNNLA